MKRLLVYLKDYKVESVLGPLFKLLEASFELLVPLVVSSIVTYGIGQSNLLHVYKMCGVLILLALIGLVSSVTAQYFAAKAAVGFSTKLRAALFAHIESLSFSEMDEVGISTLITRMSSDVNQVQSGVNMTLRLFLRSPFIVFGAMVMAFFVNVKAALVFVVTIPLLAVVVFGVMVITMPLFKKVQKSLDKILGHSRENLAGARVFRAFNKQEENVEKFNEDNKVLTNMQRLVGRISALTNPLTYVIVNVATILVIWISGKQVFFGILTQGDVIALVNYMSQILVELVKLANLIVLVTKSLACANRIAEVLELESSLEKTKDAFATQETTTLADDDVVVEFSGVSMRYYDAAEESLSDISFQVRKGQTIGIIGGTGSGKSSLVHLIPRFYDVSAGAVYVDGKDVRSYELSELREKIGMVMQKAVLFSGSIADNLRWGKEDATEEEMWQALSVAQAVDVVKGKEGELSHIIEEGGKNLSGGQKQRLTIARAVVKDPKILILDDSASALDYATDANLRKALQQMQGDKVIFIVSQRTTSIAHADQIIVLDDGCVVGMGTHEKLLSDCEVYKEIYESQFKREETA